MKCWGAMVALIGIGRHISVARGLFIQLQTSNSELLSQWMKLRSHIKANSNVHKTRNNLHPGRYHNYKDLTSRFRFLAIVKCVINGKQEK